MHVIIPTFWLNHPIVKNRIVIKSRNQMQRIIDSGFDEVKIEISKSVPAVESKTVGHKYKSLRPPDRWEPGKLVPPEMLQAIHDRNLPPAKKAHIIYKSSVELLEKLFDDPRAENIQEAKQGAAEIVDLVLSQEETSQYLLRITSHDIYTYTHSVKVGFLAILLSKHLFKKSDAHDMHELGASFFLHDLGKVRVDPAIIRKQGRLTREEMDIMKRHPYHGFKILQEANQLSKECAIITMQHHERDDGTGYPMGLKGERIHIYGRICCIADVYDALTGERSYKPKLTPFEALKVMKEEMLNHFHRDIFEQFVLLFTDMGVKRT
jgi:HD-GYP domain-containing protein (c-di-GMP phosphodiesterase class II)